MAFLVRNPGDVWECTRSCVGLAIENLNVGLFIIDATVEMEERTEDYLDLLEMIDDLEGRIFTNVSNNAERFSFMNYMSLKDMAREIRKYDLLTVF